MTDASQHEQPPQRLSALYQYHNAPEVAPAHGLEHDDDCIYPASDKCTVIRETGLPNTYRRRGFGQHGRPPRIIFGMKFQMFLLVTFGMILIIVAAAVGGAVGGRNIKGHGDLVNPSTVNSSSGSSSSSNTSTPKPTIDCPVANQSTYLSLYAQDSSVSILARAGLNFTKYCEVNNPLALPGAQVIGAAFVYTFSDCIDTCAAYNVWNNGNNCTVAVYQVGDNRPGNCWMGHISNFNATSFSSAQGRGVALLQPIS